jgi:hypothetical protein
VLQVTGFLSILFALFLAMGSLSRGKHSTPAARALAMGLTIWFVRYGLRLTIPDSDTASRLSDPLVLAVSTGMLAMVGCIYLLEGRIE